MKIRLNTVIAGAAIAGLILLLPTFARAQDTANQHLDNGAKKMVKSADASFAMKAAQGGVAEVKLGQLAAEKGGSPDIKAFGQQMVDDHTKANDDLKTTAEKEGMTLPSDMNVKQQAMYDKLSKLSGPAFDRAFAKDMVADHEQDVKEFQKEANSGKDEQIKQFASRTLPVIQGHLDKIKSIQSNLGSGNSSGK